MRIINTVAGDVKINRDGINELNNGRDINLHIGDKTISFNTVKYSPVENLSIELPTVGIGLTQANDVIDLKTASSDELGGIKVGDGLTIDEDGVLSANIT